MPVTQHVRHMTLLGLSERYIYGRAVLLRQLEAALPVPILEATPAMLLDWRADMGHAPAVICNYVSHARQFYDWARRAGLRPDNPAADIPVPRVPGRQARPIAAEDLLRALDGAPPRIRVWLVLGAWCGLRCCEIAGLRSENIMLRGDPPAIRVAWDATKGTTERTVPLCSFAAGELAAAGLPARGWAFRRADGQPGPNKPWRISRLMGDYLKECDIPSVPHDLRHFFLSEFYGLDGDLLLTAQVAGHKSTDSTKGYVKLKQRKAAETVRRLPVPGDLRRAA